MNGRMDIDLTRDVDEVNTPTNVQLIVLSYKLA